jgi:release factor glutamine methyltransferase
MLNRKAGSVNFKNQRGDHGASVAQALFWAASRLAAKGVESPLRDAQDLLAQALKMERAKLLAARELEVSPAAGQVFAKLVRRRAQREPLQYLLGQAEFCGQIFKIGPGVLIPRPETELVVAEAVRRCADFLPVRIVDLGTGSGCLALTLASQYPQARVWGLDVSAAALHWARLNQRRISQGNCRFLLKNAGSKFSAGWQKQFSLVVSNPPYIPQKDLAGLQPEVLREPHLALAGGKRGLDKISLMLGAAAGLLASGGAAVFEIGIRQAPEVVRMFAEQGFKEIQQVKDWNNIIRIVSGVKT